MNTLAGSGRYPAKGAHSTKPARAYRRRAGSEERRRAGLQADPPVAPAPRLVQQRAEHAGTDAPAAGGRAGAHRLDLAVLRVELEQRAAAEQRSAVTRRPDRDARCAERVHVERMHAAGRRRRPHLGEVSRQQRAHVGPAQVVDLDPHAASRGHRGRRACGAASCLGGSPRPEVRSAPAPPRRPAAGPAGSAPLGRAPPPRRPPGRRPPGRRRRACRPPTGPSPRAPHGPGPRAARAPAPRPRRRAPPDRPQGCARPRAAGRRPAGA